MRLFNTLKQKLIFYLILCSILPTAAIFFSITYMGNRIVKNQISNELNELAILLEGHLNQFLVAGKQISKLIASEIYIKEELELFNKDELPLKSTQKSLSQYLQSKCNLLNGILSITILNKKGIVIASSNNRYLGHDQSDNLHYKIGKDIPAVSDVYFSKEYQCGVIDFIAPVLSDYKDAFLGQLIVQIDKSELDKITTGDLHLISYRKNTEKNVKEKKEMTTVRRGGNKLIVSDENYSSKSRKEMQEIIRKGSTREAYLVNKDKLMVTASRFMQDTFLKQPVNTGAVTYSIDNQKPFSGICEDYRGEKVLSFTRFIKEPGWILIVETDLHEALLPIKKGRYFAMMAFGGSFSCIIVLASIATLRITRHVLLVEKAIKNISSGNLNTHVDYNYQIGDELKNLTTSLNEMTTAVKESKDALRNLFDAANDPMFIISDGEKITDINKRVTEIFGYEKEELIGNSITRILGTRYIPFVKQAIAYTWNLPPGKKYPTFDVSVATRTNKEVVCELDLNRTAYGLQPHMRDVTETRRLEGVLEKKNQELEEALKNLKETQAQLIQAGKLAGIGELASGVAHEINNPLTAIMGHALRLLRKVESKELKEIKALEPFQAELKIITDASLRCKRITDSLLRFSRVSTELKSNNINLNTVIDDTLILLENTLRQKKINLTKQLDPNLKYIMGDHNQLQQVFTNIINNSIHAMARGGNLLIATGEKVIHSNPSFLTVDTEKVKTYVEIEFTDTGCGIKEEHISKIFDPFFTTKEPGKGTGLGLSISYRIVKDHHGWIDVKSTLGKGTSFFVILPASTLST